jgi:hypothetical protein
MLAVLLLFVCGCQMQARGLAVAIDPEVAKTNLQTALQDLPEGVGKELTASACTRCHNLSGLSAYKGYWNRKQWRAMVEGMVKHGAVLDAAQQLLVTDYLNSSYGRPGGQ